MVWVTSSGGILCQFNWTGWAICISLRHSCDIWGSHCGEYQHCCIMGCDVVQFDWLGGGGNILRKSVEIVHLAGLCCKFFRNSSFLPGMHGMTSEKTITYIGQNSSGSCTELIFRESKPVVEKSKQPCGRADCLNVVTERVTRLLLLMVPVVQSECLEYFFFFQNLHLSTRRELFQFRKIQLKVVRLYCSVQTAAYRRQIPDIFLHHCVNSHREL